MGLRTLGLKTKLSVDLQKYAVHRTEENTFGKSSTVEVNQRHVTPLGIKAAELKDLQTYCRKGIFLTQRATMCQ
ncbi:hypothetical protein RRG08_033324 [Elysia crispata]|uniref:Uncharacterized protein n=1 Tax=Elysia crispata TaxID=231223 RepID=A0AAE1CJ63_9GAST|nr:hypothetical protein RRG08_033324 [Elysia crispata]